MIEIFRKIWKFAGVEQKNIRKSILVSFLNSVFHMLQIGGIFLTVQALVNQTVRTSTIVTIVVLMVSSILGKIITNYFSQLQQTHSGYYMAANKRIVIGNKMKLIPMGYFNESSLGNMTGICTTVLGDVELTAPMVMVLTLGGFITTVVFTVYMILFDWRMGGIAAIIILLYCLLTSAMEKKSRVTAPKRQKAQAKLVEHMVETIQGMSVVKSFNLTRLDNKKVDQAIEGSKDTNLAMERVITPFTIMQECILRAGSVVLILAALLFYFAGTMELTYTLMFIVISFIVFEQIESAGHGVAILRVCGSSIEQANEIDEVEVLDGNGIRTKLDCHDVVFENVHFSYEKKAILKDVNFKIEDQTMTAIIGPSGSGKTTICSLIARFWDVDRGCISIGGTNIRELKLESLMEQISMVFQTVYLFHDTIENNIRFGRPEATREEVIAAAKKACCHDFISNLPEGYDTMLGEGGFALSGGEKQRISIARAVLKDAPIIIFDEATANVDPENEVLLQNAMEELTKNKTIIIIAHRIKTVRNADQILVVDHGEIVQRGNHQQLIVQEGLYQRFVGERKEVSSWTLSA